MGCEWAPSLGRSAAAIVKAAVSFDAWMIGVLFKGLTFSGRFFEMVIRHLAAGGAAVLPANGVNQSQMWAPHVDSPDRSCQFLAPVRREGGEQPGAAGRGIALLSRLWMFTCICSKL